jgi:hypothetical protein
MHPLRTHPPESITAQKHELVTRRDLKCSNVRLAAAAGLQGDTPGKHAWIRMCAPARQGSWCRVCTMHLDEVVAAWQTSGQAAKSAGHPLWHSGRLSYQAHRHVLTTSQHLGSPTFLTARSPKLRAICSRPFSLPSYIAPACHVRASMHMLVQA